jgi:hypothetical protein
MWLIPYGRLIDVAGEKLYAGFPVGSAGGVEVEAEGEVFRKPGAVGDQDILFFYLGELAGGRGRGRDEH